MGDLTYYLTDELNLPDVSKYDLRWQLTSNLDEYTLWLGKNEQYGRNVTLLKCEPSATSIKDAAETTLRNYEAFLDLHLDTAALPQVEGNEWEMTELTLASGFISLSLGKGSYDRANAYVKLNQKALDAAVKRLVAKRERIVAFAKRNFKLPALGNGLRWHIDAVGLTEPSAVVELRNAEGQVIAKRTTGMTGLSVYLTALVMRRVQKRADRLFLPRTAENLTLRVDANPYREV